jgi:hypothetical protein
MIWHPEILTPRQQWALVQLGRILTPRGFHLAGGTALALQLGHRRSVDLDWFTSDRILDPLRVAQELRETGAPFVTTQVAPGTLHGTVRGVRVSLLEYRYPLLRPIRSWRLGECRLASLADLAALKLAAVAQRGSKKDFVDIYSLALRRFSLRQMLRWYQQKYAVQDIAHVLYSLIYFDDADRERLPRILWQMDWRTIKAALRRWLKEITSRAEPEA